MNTGEAGSGAQSADGASAERGAAVDDSALAPWRKELLELASRAASKMPLEPHIKNRSRAQAEALAAWIELGQFERAEALSEDIANWRQGVVLGELAHQAARRGDIARADALAAKAAGVMEATAATDDQEWRAQSVLAKLALTDLTLERNEGVVDKERALEHSERRELVRAKAQLLDMDEVEFQIEEYRRLLESKDFEVLQNVLAGALELYDRTYTNEGFRASLEALAAETLRTMPSTLRFRTHADWADVALAKGDRLTARGFVDAAEAVLASSEWLPEDMIGARGRLGALRVQLGDDAPGRALLGSAKEHFVLNRDRIPDVFRGDALRPLARAYLDAGEPEAALSLYRELVEEGLLNPNSRPRAVDLVRTACSLAVLGLEPDAALLARMREAEGQLGEPW